MLIRIKNGEVRKFVDSGSVAAQAKNLNALIVTLQNHAGALQVLASKMLISADREQPEAVAELVKENKTLRRTLEMAEKQLRRNQTEKREA